MKAEEDVGSGVCVRVCVCACVCVCVACVCASVCQREARTTMLLCIFNPFLCLIYGLFMLILHFASPDPPSHPSSLPALPPSALMHKRTATTTAKERNAPPRANAIAAAAAGSGLIRQTPAAHGRGALDAIRRGACRWGAPRLGRVRGRACALRAPSYAGIQRSSLWASGQRQRSSYALPPLVLLLL